MVGLLGIDRSDNYEGYNAHSPANDWCDNAHRWPVSFPYTRNIHAGLRYFLRQAGR